jgi:DNA-binding MurR/RpiR family transcriptional regulator
MLNKSEKSNLDKLIIQKYPELSKKEQLVADFLLQTQHTIIVLSGKEVAAHSGVSEATIVRFAKRLGFTGYRSLKFHLVQEAKEMVMPEDSFKLLSRERNHVSTANRVADMEIENIRQTISQINPEQLKDFVQILRNSRQIFTIGLGISSLMARIAAYLFNQAGVRAFACQKDEHAFIERLIHLRMKDVVLALSFPPYSKETIEALKFCNQRDVQCLAITDKPTAPIVEWSHAHLIVKSNNMFFTNATAAISMILNTLATELAFSHKTKAANNSKLIFSLLRDEYLP